MNDESSPSKSNMPQNEGFYFTNNKEARNTKFEWEFSTLRMPYKIESVPLSDTSLGILQEPRYHSLIPSC